jgi:hypothetical protein
MLLGINMILRLRYHWPLIDCWQTQISKSLKIKKESIAERDGNERTDMD